MVVILCCLAIIAVFVIRFFSKKMPKRSKPAIKGLSSFWMLLYIVIACVVVGWLLMHLIEPMKEIFSFTMPE